MARYLTVRAALALVSIVGVVLLTFALQFALPGDPARRIAGPRATPIVLETVRERLHLDAPLHAQLGHYLAGVARGDLGESYVRRRPVADVISERLPNTLLLAAVGLAAELVLGGALGVWDGLRRRRSRLLAAGNVLLLSIPTFTLAFLFLFVFAYRIALFPLGGGPGLAEVVLPALTLGLFGVPYYASVISESMREALSSSWTRTAVAKGLSRRRIVVRHVLRSSLSPVITLAGMDFAVFLSGLVFIEAVFGWPGIGLLQQNAFDQLDRPLLMGTVIVGASVVVAFNLVADVVRSLVDPRARASG